MDELCNNAPRLRDVPCAVVHDGLPLPQLPSDADRALARRQLELPDDKCLVLFAGQLIQRKGLADLLHAWMLLSDESRATAELLVVGDDLQNRGDYRVAMERLARYR